VIGSSPRSAPVMASDRPVAGVTMIAFFLMSVILQPEQLGRHHLSPHPGRAPRDEIL
jgi:hypothetical protein